MRDFHLSPYVPRRRVARRLWAEGVFERELLEAAERLGDDPREAFDRCERLELVLPLAHLLGADATTIACVLVSWWVEALDLLGHRGWDAETEETSMTLLGAACEPDPTLPALRELIERAMVLAGRRGRGAHRYRMLMAAAAIGNVRAQAFAVRARPCADLELAATHILGALTDAAELAGGDLFATRPDLEAFVRAGLSVRADLVPGSAA